MKSKLYLDALDYAKNVAERMEAIPLKEYFLRADKQTSNLIIEEWPLACFGKILYHPHRRIKVFYQGDKPDGIPDAEVIVEGEQKVIEGWDDVTPVEITSVQFVGSHLVRKELGLTGSSVGHVKGFNDEIIGFIPEAVRSLNNKYRNAYSPNTMIICAIFPELPFGRIDWNMLMDAVAEQLSGMVKYKTVILDTFTCQHFIIRPSLTEIRA